MKKYSLLGLVLAITFSACDKDHDQMPTLPGDQQTIRMKDYTIPSLPSPWYHLDYDNNGFITAAAHSSGEWNYEVHYLNGRISYMKNTSPANKDSISYSYTNGQIDIVRVFEQSGEQYRRCFVDYDGKGRIISLDWEKKVNPGYIAERSLSFSYHADGNLSQRIDRRFAVPGGPPASESIDNYSDYDDKPNVAGYTLPHEGYGQFVLFPSIKFQINNARKIERRNNGIDHYRIIYSYIYNSANLPLERNGVMTYLSGPETGNSFNLKAFFTYY